MKKSFGAALLLPALLASTAGHGQKLSETEVPQAVKSAFLKQFPQAQGAKWEMEDKVSYEAEFNDAGTKRSANYAADGTWLETESAMKADQLPDAVRKAIATGYASSRVGEAETVLTPKGTNYEVELEKDGKTMEVVFSADGSVIKTKAEEEDEKGEEEDGDKD